MYESHGNNDILKLFIDKTKQNINIRVGWSDLSQGGVDPETVVNETSIVLLTTNDKNMKKCLSG